MATTFTTLKTFISSADDVKKERKSTTKIIREINASIKETLQFELVPVTWEAQPPKTPNIPEENIQDILNKEIKNCKIFILILYKRYGRTESGHQKSYLEREVDLAIDILKKHKKLTILSYFKEIPKNEDEGPQEKCIKALIKKLEDRGIWYKKFKDNDHFKDLLTHDLYRTMLRFRLSTKKISALHKFWKFGIPDRPTLPLLAIFYPPIDRSFMGKPQTKNVWEYRLKPNIVFEDYKALQKIEKTLKLINYREYKIYNSYDFLPGDIRYMNTLWVCVPRNPKSNKFLTRHQGKVNFSFKVENDHRKSKLIWRPNLKKNQKVIIKSPLSKYLKRQRKDYDKNSEWQPQMSQIIAKDYGVIARFSHIPTSPSIVDGVLKDYFLAGMRGLGTWGAGWFIDREYNNFLNYEEDDDLQILLEVTYCDGRIFEVKDVSKESQAYFNLQNNNEYIEEQIKNYQFHKIL